MGLLRDLVRRSVLAWHRPRHWRLRPGTLDARIFRHVVVDNEYRLPRRFRPDDVILDVGGHVGSFALAALRRGAGKVVVCEPDPDNFAVLRHNLAPFGGRVELRHVAVWGDDVPAGGLRVANPLDARNTGACRVGVAAGSPVEVVPLDTLIRQGVADGNIRLVKLDCEGAEWPILTGSRWLTEADEVCGEYHLGDFAPAGASVDRMEALLAGHGFRVEVEPDDRSPYPVGLFFARR